MSNDEVANWLLVATVYRCYDIMHVIKIFYRAGHF